MWSRNSSPSRMERLTILRLPGRSGFMTAGSDDSRRQLPAQTLADGEMRRSCHLCSPMMLLSGSLIVAHQPQGCCAG